MKVRPLQLQVVFTNKSKLPSCMPLRNDLLDVTATTLTSYSIQTSQGPGCRPEPCRRVLRKVPKVTLKGGKLRRNLKGVTM